MERVAAGVLLEEVNQTPRVNTAGVEDGEAAVRAEFVPSVPTKRFRAKSEELGDTIRNDWRISFNERARKCKKVGALSLQIRSPDRRTGHPESARVFIRHIDAKGLLLVPAPHGRTRSIGDEPWRVEVIGVTNLR